MTDNEVPIDPNTGKNMFYTFDDSGNYTGSIFSVDQPTNSTKTPPTKPYTDENGAIVAGVEIGLTNPTWDSASQKWIENASSNMTTEQQLIVQQTTQIATMQQLITAQAQTISQLEATVTSDGVQIKQLQQIVMQQTKPQADGVKTTTDTNTTND
jgi:hypothetical protein